MRIAIGNRSSYAVGGVEEYIARISGALVSAGHEVSYFFEHRRHDVAAIPLRSGQSSWAANEIGIDAAFEAVRSWQPDVVYCNGFDSPTTEDAFARLAASAYSAHAYFGTCISGNKMFAFPDRRPCAREFGAACLGQFFPRRCGGLNPLTMINMYRTERARLEVIRRYDAVVVHSQHMKAEYSRHGVDAHIVPLPIVDSEGTCVPLDGKAGARLLFLGRMSPLKGGDLLIAAVEKIACTSTGPIEMVMAGDGSERTTWQARAAEVSRRLPHVSIRFPGTVDPADRDALFRWANLLVVPSCWPEPFGMVGLEAAAFGVPAAAYDVGGIREWLREGENGLLASSRPPNADDLASIILRCLEPERHARLSRGARSVCNEWKARTPAAELGLLFSRLVSQRK